MGGHNTLGDTSTVLYPPFFENLYVRMISCVRLSAIYVGQMKMFAKALNVFSMNT